MRDVPGLLYLREKLYGVVVLVRLRRVWLRELRAQTLERLQGSVRALYALYFWVLFYKPLCIRLGSFRYRLHVMHVCESCVVFLTICVFYLAALKVLF